MARRLAAPGIAALVLLATLLGLRGVASLLLLAAIVAGAVRLIDAVGLAAERRGDRLAVVTSGAGLVCFVAAGAAHVPLIVVGLFACAAVEVLGRPTAGEAVPEPVELLETPVSHAA